MANVIRINLTGEDAVYARAVADQLNIPVAQVVRIGLRSLQNHGLPDLTQVDTSRPKENQVDLTHVDTERPKETQVKPVRPNLTQVDTQVEKKFSIDTLAQYSA